jgi:hypothetical protein
MDIKEFLSVIFKPIWTWIIGGFFAIIGVAIFFIPDLGLILNWPSLSKSLPWYFWLSIALFIWSLGIAWESVSRIRKEPTELKKLGDIRKDGVAKRNSAFGITTEKEVEQFINDHDQWVRMMLSEVKKLSPAMASELEILDTFPIIALPKVVNDKHSKYLSMFSERLHRLDMFILNLTLEYHRK